MRRTILAGYRVARLCLALPFFTLTAAALAQSDLVSENAMARLPQVGDHGLRILTPRVLELQRITTKQPDPATVTEWTFAGANGEFAAPAAGEVVVTVNGQPVSAKATGFRRRAAYAPLRARDLRIDNALFVEVDAEIPANATVEVTNPSGALWPVSFRFTAVAGARRFNPAIHVNQEGYAPALPKQAQVGYYLGSAGELEAGVTTFEVVDAVSGAAVFSGALSARRETGYVYSPQPYQKVLEADFSAFSTPGEYQLVVPGLGASLPFVIHDGVAMNFARTYAQGLYHQRCGAACSLPFTRFTHEACHTAPALIPSGAEGAFTFKTIGERNGDAKNNPRHTAPRVVSEETLLYPFVNKGAVDVALGHHDAGDYSKYITNSAALAHLLMFTAEAVPGAAALDNLGLPESGDGISDLMQEAKHEADYIAKMQDADGGFYFLVYPKNRSYEGDVAPDKGDPQVVWPKNTAGSAAATAVLAQLGSSPLFKAAYPAEAAAYLAKAKRGWEFLATAIARHGKDGAYQKFTHYGDTFMHDDELAWAACELFLATGEAQYREKLQEWFPNPNDPETARWGWMRMCEAYGNSIRSYAFAARTGRIAAGQLDAGYLQRCEQEIVLAGDETLRWCKQSPYGVALPEATRHVMAAGWFFSLDQAADMAVAHVLSPKPDYIAALTGNMNYEAGSNPVNVAFLTGVGVKRQREIVHQWTNVDERMLPMNGIPLGNVQSGPMALPGYTAAGNELAKLSFPSDEKGAQMFPFYDRWTDTWNVMTEFVVVNQARGLLALIVLALQTPAAAQPWKPTATAAINVPGTVARIGEPVTLTLNTEGLDLTGARILWEARDQQPDFGREFVVVPRNTGKQWVEVEISWPDGRRMVGVASFMANAPLVNWVDDALPKDSFTSSGGGDTWNWQDDAQAPSGTKVHVSDAASGLHEHAFNGATAALDVAVGDTLFAWVHLDPANPPEQIMLSWNDGNWEHRAFWGADRISYGMAGTAGRVRMGDLPAVGQWVRLEIPAAVVALENAKMTGMAFSAFGGRVVWDAAGKITPME